jgi:hypothetical protein
MLTKDPDPRLLGSILPGLADFPINRIVELTPNAWLTRNKNPQKSGAEINRGLLGRTLSTLSLAWAARSEGNGGPELIRSAWARNPAGVLQALGVRLG